MEISVIPENSQIWKGHLSAQFPVQ